MFKINQNEEVDRKTFKCNYIRYSPSQKKTIKPAISQICVNIPREDSVNFLLNIYLDLDCDVAHSATNNRYAVGNDIRLVNLGTNSFIQPF